MHENLIHLHKSIQVEQTNFTNQYHYCPKLFVCLNFRSTIQKLRYSIKPKFYICCLGYYFKNQIVRLIRKPSDTTKIPLWRWVWEHYPRAWVRVRSFSLSLTPLILTWRIVAIWILLTWLMTSQFLYPCPISNEEQRVIWCWNYISPWSNNNRQILYLIRLHYLNQLSSSVIPTGTIHLVIIRK